MVGADDDLTGLDVGDAMALLGAKTLPAWGDVTCTVVEGRRQSSRRYVARICMPAHCLCAAFQMDNLSVCLHLGSNPEHSFGVAAWRFTGKC